VSPIHHKGELGKSLDIYKKDKMYPHISDEYDFKINNRLLLSKIINPRRDKTIMDSLINASSKYSVCLRKKKAEDNIVPSMIK
jgi:hypothetical protein